MEWKFFQFLVCLNFEDEMCWRQIGDINWRYLSTLASDTDIQKMSSEYICHQHLCSLKILILLLGSFKMTQYVIMNTKFILFICSFRKPKVLFIWKHFDLVLVLSRRASRQLRIKWWETFQSLKLENWTF